ncbi:MAG: DUF4294 domain-containing protein [Chitinophagaceae bacterium]|nr:DUF4294 domain-containing protein [Chitinophagaceae bacterium]
MIMLLAAGWANPVKAQYGINDTLLVGAVIEDGDTIPARILPVVFVWQKGKHSKKWTRLRNAVYVTYPYARTAGAVFTDIEKNIAGMDSKKERRQYINSREKELKKEFTDPLKELSVYQGKILMKLINRETGGTNCYDILKELKGGVTARFWQTVAFIFGSNLKQPYDAYGNDSEIEVIVQEVQRMYGWQQYQ